MEFDKRKVYTSLNADELKPGSKVICAFTMSGLKKRVGEGEEITEVHQILSEEVEQRIEVYYGDTFFSYLLAYLISEPEGILSKPGHIFPSDKGYGDLDEEYGQRPLEEIIDKVREKNSEQYVKFSIARYALTDVLEELHKSNAKDIIVTKEDDGLLVKYKPYWKLN